MGREGPGELQRPQQQVSADPFTRHSPNDSQTLGVFFLNFKDKKGNLNSARIRQSPWINQGSGGITRTGTLETVPQVEPSAWASHPQGLSVTGNVPACTIFPTPGLLPPIFAPLL